PSWLSDRLPKLDPRLQTSPDASPSTSCFFHPVPAERSRIHLSVSCLAERSSDCPSPVLPRRLFRSLRVWWRPERRRRPCPRASRFRRRSFLWESLLRNRRTQSDDLRP